MGDAFGRALTIYFTRVGNTDFDEDVDAVASASLIAVGENVLDVYDKDVATAREQVTGWLKSLSE